MSYVDQSLSLYQQMIKVDVTVSNLSFRAAKPDNQSLPMPNDGVDKAIFFNTASSDRLNNRVYGTLKKGKALSEACKVIQVRRH
jgi:hypothetical protein